MLAAGLLAKKAVERGLSVSPTGQGFPGARLAGGHGVPGTTGLQPYLDQLGFNLVGYGCTTCIGNSGPLDPRIEEVVTGNDLVAASVLSGNRNFEARVHQSIKANFLMSPPLVVAFALAGTRGHRHDEGAARAGIARGDEVYLRDIWPSPAEIRERPAVLHRPGDLPETLLGLRRRQSPLERDPGHGGKGLSLGRGLDVHPGAAVLRELLHEARSRSATSAARGRWRSSATRSRPTTSARRARSSRRLPPASTCRSRASRRRTSTATARGAATIA